MLFFVLLFRKISDLLYHKIHGNPNSRQAANYGIDRIIIGIRLVQFHAAIGAKANNGDHLKRYARKTGIGINSVALPLLFGFFGLGQTGNFGLLAFRRPKIFPEGRPFQVASLLKMFPSSSRKR